MVECFTFFPVPWTDCWTWFLMHSEVKSCKVLTELILSLTLIGSSGNNCQMVFSKTLWRATSITSSLTRQIVVSVSLVGPTAIGWIEVDRCRNSLGDSGSWRVSRMGCLADILLYLIDKPLIVTQVLVARTTVKVAFRIVVVLAKIVDRNKEICYIGTPNFL